eukprot:TRINITY_DN6568_c0_g2_i2.p1 TRINITY_DN6568_c0_g2~~TRINITY_DN6568_c0_g2_i2.p1  ORF type:complete len:105 (+),score=21.12 TRINITY_DN6568_c0_g2_i2:399-713(+)
MKCEEVLRTESFQNVLLSGGSTNFPGFPERMKREVEISMARHAPELRSFKVLAPPERKLFVWIGGSILACMSNHVENWISKEEYDEFGPSIVHTKNEQPPKHGK